MQWEISDMKNTDHAWCRRAKKDLAERKAAGRLRDLDLRTFCGPQGAQIDCGGKQVINFCSNNYLGLAGDVRGNSLWEEAFTKVGFGAGASRLVCGNSEEVAALEQEIAAFKGHEAALVFPTGYMTNVGVISALCKAEDVIFSDKLNHASIVDGCRQSRANTHIYRHADLDHLEKILRCENAKGMKWIISDAVFSMDGDLCPLAGLVSLAEQYDAWIILDDAHGTGVLGKAGKGAMDHLGIESSRILAVTGTFSKALGTLGGFVVGSCLLRDYLVNHARTLIYTTGMPPALAAYTRRALEFCKQADESRQTLRQSVQCVGAFLQEIGYQNVLDEYISPIIPIVVGASKDAVALDRYLFDKGILASAIRPPTVPQGTARLRISLMVTHTQAHLARFFEATKDAIKEGVWQL